MGSFIFNTTRALHSRAHARLRPSVRLYLARHIGGIVQRVGVEFARVERGPLVLGHSAGGVLERVANGREGRRIVRRQGVLGRLEEAVLHPRVRLTTSVVAVAGDAAHIVVVEVGVFQIVSAGVALVGAVEVVVVDGALRNEVVRPALYSTSG